MNDFRLSPDDPKLTAYALGELPEKERAAVEAAIRHDPAAQITVEHIRAFAAELETALANEPDPETGPMPEPLLAEVAATPPQSVNGRHPGAPTARALPHYGRGSNVLRFPQLYYVIGGLAAACFAVMLALRTEPAGQLKVAAEEAGPAKTPTPPQVSTPTPPQASVPAAVAADVPALAAPAIAPRAEEPVQQLAANETPVKLDAVPVSAATSQTNAAGSGLLEQVRTPEAQAAITPAPAPTVQDVVPLPTKSSYAVNFSSGISERRAKVPLSVPPVARPAGQPDGEMLLSAFTVAPTKVALRKQGLGRGGADNSGLRLERPPAPESAWGSNLGKAAPDSHEAQRPDAVEGFAYRLPEPTGPAHVVPAPWPIRPPATVWPKFVPERESRAPARAESGNQSYVYRPDNPFVSPANEPFSTFAVDVDTASYTNVQQFIEAKRLPPPDAVRIEELLNYFPFNVDAPAVESGGGAAAPFATALEVADAPWASGHRLVRIGIRARDVAAPARPAANLVFLVDVSGSMRSDAKLPLVKQAMRVLVNALRPEDRVAVVTYAGTSGLALPSTPVAKRRSILEALDGLSTGGSTNGGMGIQLAYDIAKANFVPGGINRVILCTDGDFNVGATSQGELARLVEEKAKSGVALTVLGFGMQNVKDGTLELLADKGHGSFGYVDSQAQAEKLLAQQVNATLLTVAKDVKVQIDFNPAQVASYRLIGYENRLLSKEDFNNPAVDGGDLGAGHIVTALYEVVPVDAASGARIPPVDRSRYAAESPAPVVANPAASELLAVKIRYRTPEADVSQKVEVPLTDTGATFDRASRDFKFAAAVAAYGMVLRDSPHRGSATLDDVIAWASAGAGTDADDIGGYRHAFVELARRTQALLQ